MINKWKSSTCLATIIVASGLATSALSTTAQAQTSTQWGGFYIGGHVGAYDQDTDGIFKTGDSEVNFNQLDLSGVVGGGQLGYNWDLGSWVVGIEGDVSFIHDFGAAHAPSSSELGTGEIDLLASIRGRIGVTVDTQRTVLAYATGGVALRKAEAEVFDDDPGASGVAMQRIDFDDIGAVVGGGLEWAATDRLRLRVEGLYYMVGERSAITLSEANSGDFVEFDDAWTVRFGVSWYF